MKIKKTVDLAALADDPLFATVPGHHGFGCGVISLFLGLVGLGTSLRAASRVIDFIARVFNLPLSAPHWTTGRLWLLRFGLAQRESTKDRADDWVWMIDHSVQIGTDKVLVILGIRARDMPPAGEHLCLTDMVLIDLVPMRTSTGKDVADRLKDGVGRTGVPRAIVDDHGGDLVGGVRIFQQDHPETVEIYDVKHKAACLLRSLLETNPRWLAFGIAMGKTRCEIQQTELGVLTPPSPKLKARFMNLKSQLDWAGNVLALLKGPRAAVPTWATRPRLHAKLGWLRRFDDELTEWREWQAIIDMTVGFVGSEGLHAKTAVTLSKKLRPVRRSKSGRKLAAKLIRFVREQASQLKPGERLPGSTEVLESGFGKFKTLEKGQAKGGFTSLILSFGTMFADATMDQVHKAMTAVPTGKVKEWCVKHLGQTLTSQRKEVFASARKAQQKLTGAIS